MLCLLKPFSDIFIVGLDEIAELFSVLLQEHGVAKIIFAKYIFV